MTQVVTFYRFVPVADPRALADAVFAAAARSSLLGTVLVAAEGINGTLAGAEAAVGDFCRWLTGDPRFAEVRFRYSTAAAGNAVFHRLKVRIKNEIVALRQPGVDAHARVGVHVDATRWNTLLDDPDTVVIDTRNEYEIGVGTFPGALNPGTRSFRQFPDWVARNLDPARHRKIAMFCTGGVRCEKASAYLLGVGFESVMQLDGGVLGYLETAGADNRWQGECYVFDQRVTVDEALAEGEFEMCHGCRRPIAPSDRSSPSYEPGVSCPRCADDLTEAQRAAFTERARQERLAVARGERHVGALAVHRRGGIH